MGKRLYVGNLPYDADEAMLREAFGQDGRMVERVHIVIDRETQRPRGFAFVEMATDEQAKLAIAAMDGTMFGPRQLRVTEAEERRPAGPGGPGGPRGPGGGGGGYSGGPRPDRGPSSGAPSPRYSGGGGGGGGYSGGGGGGGGYSGGPSRDDPSRNRFGPDARPKGERGPAPKKAAPRRREDDSDAFGGRRGSGRFDDDEDE
ncbi:MAG: RNA-binding protein [Planctomycetes bacterium]|nr:RNA-binding protein [Planctomycetota bacterium]